MIFRKKEKIHTKRVHNLVASLGVGIVLGVLSAFLGIGGGPFNLTILDYFFSMDTKKAAKASPFIIMFSNTISKPHYVTTNPKTRRQSQQS